MLKIEIFQNIIYQFFNLNFFVLANCHKDANCLMRQSEISNPIFWEKKLRKKMSLHCCQLNLLQDDNAKNRNIPEYNLPIF